MPHFKFFYNHKADILPTKLVFPQLGRYSDWPASILSLSFALGIVSIALLNTSFSSAIAQITISEERKLDNEKILSQVNVLFVNPSAGDDKVGNGSASAPWKTITQALQVAQPNSLIILSPGTYSAKTGEVFPLFLKPGVAIQGDIRNKGRDIKIIGGGEYLSRSFGGQNVTIVGANQTSLTGVTLTNSNPRGYGLWLESTNLLVQENTFTANTQDGISVTGNATPTISNNYFYRNGANGITVTGNSRPEVLENVFQQTGFGINIAQNAAPLIIGNQILNNRSGIIAQANTRPTLRNNLIAGSQEDGLVIIAQATPDLGNFTEPGGNQFRNNGRYDINAKAAKQLISAPGNNLAKNRIIGNVDINARTAPIARNSPPDSFSLQETPQGREIVFAAPTITTTPNQYLAIVPSDRTTSPNGQLSPIPANVQTSFPSNNSQLTTSGEQSDTRQLNYVRIEPGVIEFTAPQASLPNNSVIISAPKLYTTTSRSVRYRVIVPVTNNQQREVVLSVAPDAFSKTWQGRKVMQVGTFSSQNNASEMVQILSSKGLKAIIQPLN
ncbi:DUF1565 domain-containing protein [Anabaena lutea]|uniref:DUF1565 domain-containing protein n=1 Tax=Anabaena lutea FACHB-196 TaxID=2692881 RepID=A0ABR8FIH7_9NOST|nr:DUF1565 domain-containing protein [Anabaena lutea]MBD2569579.1 DUF1565 domain-containing protein [Anabaena lutea FACHB-196]